jgi:hypothetical protein
MVSFSSNNRGAGLSPLSKDKQGEVETTEREKEGGLGEVNWL